jgi:TolB protein
MAPDGSGATRLTHSPGRDAHPFFLPDGRIVFQSPRDYEAANEVDLYVMRADGSEQRRIVTTPGFDGVPVPNRAGSRLAFQRSPLRAGGEFHWELFVVDTGGRGERQLTRNAWSSQVPSWSRDDRRIVFYANPAGRDQLFLLDVGSGAVTALAPSAGEDNAPAFSPDGRSVAFVSTRDGGRHLYRVDLPAGRVTRLTSGVEIWGQPSWSADGRCILLSGITTGVNDIYSVNADGSGLTRLTRGVEGLR